MDAQQEVVSKQSMFLIVDAQNLYYSARELHGKGSRIDFLRLRERIVGDRELGAVYSVAYTPEMKDEPKSLKHVLTKLGYETQFRSDRFEEQVYQLYKVAKTYNIVAIASGDKAFAPLIRKVQETGKTVEVYAFVDAISGEIAKLANRMDYLKVDVLMGSFATLDAIRQPDESE